MEMVQIIYGMTFSAPLGEYNKSIESLNAITQGMQDKRHEMDRPAQAHDVLTSTNTVVMAQLV